MKKQLLSEKEWQLIEHSRKPNLSSVKVIYTGEGDMKTVEITQKKKVSVEARLTEVLLKGGYEKVEIHTNGEGSPISYSSTEKIKL